jgi:hypothetical protein
MPEMPPPRSPAVARRAVLLILVLFVALVTVLIARTIWIYRAYPFDADEAIHANGALAMMLDLRAGDFGAFLRTTYEQGFYPPAFSVLKALAFLALGPSQLVARGFSLVCLPVALLMIYLTSRRLDEEWGWLIGAIAVGSTLTSQFLLITAGLVMMEVPGLLASFALLLLYMHAVEKPSATRLVATSILLAITFLTKYTYGLAAVATVALFEASRLLAGEGRDEGGDQDSTASLPALARRWGWLVGPFALIMVVWFAAPSKIAAFWSYATAQPSSSSWTWEALWFYPRSIALHHSPSPLFALPMLISVVWAAQRWRRPKLRLLLIYFLVGIGEMTLNFPKSPRFIATFVPAAHILTAAMAVWCLNRWRRSSLSIGWRLTTVLLVVSLIVAVPVLFERYRTYPSLMEMVYETHPKLGELAGWVQSQIPANAGFYVINFWDQLSPWALSWHLGTHSVPPGTRFEDISMPAVLLEEATPENIASLRKKIRASGVPYVVVFEGAPWGAPVWWIYAEEMSDMLNPINRQMLYVELYDTGGWLKRSLLRKGAWERIKADGRFTLQVKTTVYEVVQP